MSYFETEFKFVVDLDFSEGHPDITAEDVDFYLAMNTGAITKLYIDEEEAIVM